MPKTSFICTPPFCDGMPKGNQNLSSKGGGDEELQNRAKSARRPLISSKMSTKTCPWAAWMVKTWSNVHRMSESFEVVGGGTSVVAPALEVSAAPVEEGGGGTLLEDAPRETQGSALKWAALWRRKVAPRGPTTWTGSFEGKSARPKNKSILWMKIGYISACPTAELLWTSFKKRRNKWGKLIEAPDINAYKNIHRFRGMVWRWEMGHKEWQATQRNKYAVSVSAEDVIRGSEPH